MNPTQPAAPKAIKKAATKKGSKIAPKADKKAGIREESESAPVSAFHNHTLDLLTTALLKEGITYAPSKPEVGRSKLYTILTDRSYLGEIKHKGQWHPGTHEPLVDRATWDRVQFLLGQKIYRSHEMTYAGELIVCGHCGHPITGELKAKKTKSGDREYVYFRCTKYHKGDHPRIRLTEAELDVQMLALFDKLRVEDDEFRNTFREELRKATNRDQRSSASKAKELQEELVRVRDHQDRLLNYGCWKRSTPTRSPRRTPSFGIGRSSYTWKSSVATEAGTKSSTSP